MKNKVESLLVQNLIYYINNILIENGDYTNISSGTRDYLGRELGKFERISNDPTYGNKRVWQAPYSNLVYESGVAVASGYYEPTIISGVYIDGVFRDRVAGGYSIDFLSGRILFDSDQSPSLQVYADYSNRGTYCDFAGRDYYLLDQTTFQNNQESIDTITYPSGTSVKNLPAVLIEWFRSEREPFQIGSSHQAKSTIFFHVFGTNEIERQNIVSTLLDLEETSLKIINFNDAPYFLNSIGDYSDGYKNYSELKTLYTSHLAYFEGVTAREVPGGPYRATIDANITVRRI